MNHHAYLYEGPLVDFEAVAASARTMLGFSDAASPDVLERQYDRFGIGESRELTQLASLRGTGTRSLVVIGVSAITTEAQQALLKLFEEPREGLTFVLLAPHGVIISTLKSRMQELPRLTDNSQSRRTDGRLPDQSVGADNLARIFLKSSPKERSDMLGKLLKQDDAREQLRTLLNDLEAYIYAAKKKDISALQEIEAMRPYLADRSASLKMIFEHLAAVLPKV